MKIIATFLALLEVITLGQARVEQAEHFADIDIVGRDTQ